MHRLTPHLTRRERRHLLGFVVAGAIPLAIAGMFTYLEADPHIQLPPRAAPPAPNGFDLYVQAADLSAQPNPPVDAASDANSPGVTNAQGAIRYGSARREAWHAGAAGAWNTFRLAQQTPTRDPYPYGADKMPGYARLRQLARDKNAETRMFQLRGENDKAVNSALDCVEMAFDISREGALISRLVATAICAIGIAPLSETRGKNAAQTPEQLSAPQARAAARRLEALLARRPSYVEAIKQERWMALGVLNKGFERGNWRAPGAFCFGNSIPEGTNLQPLARNLVSKRAVVAHINQGYDDAIAELKAPYKIIARVPAIPSGLPAPSEPLERPQLDPISPPLMPGYRLRFNAAREKTQIDLMLLRFALRAYRVEKGAYPPDLAALTGSYLKRIPTDDFASGAPYSYLLQNGDYQLWSIGPDAINNGGNAIGPTQTLAGVPAPKAATPWQKHLPTILDDSAGDVVARETR